MKQGHADKSKPKLKMSNRKFRVLLIIPMVLLAVVGLVLGVFGSIASGVLETYVDRGTNTVNVPTEKANWDGNYYDEPESAEAATEAAYAVASQVQDEGTVLLKNDDQTLPLAKDSQVMPFGYAYLSPIYGQNSWGGSAKWVSDPVTPEQGLEGLTVDNAAVEAMQAAGDPMPLVEAQGTAAAGEAGSLLGGDCKIYEYDPSIYQGIQANKDACGLVFISRGGQEGQDMKSDAYEDGTRHYLALSANERGTIQVAKEKCGRVVVVLVSSAPLEVADLVDGDLAVDAVIQYGHPGERGFSELAAILDGDVNPSGRTVDIWAADFLRDQNIARAGTSTYSNLTVISSSYTDGGEFNRPYNEYQEGVYMGYRYHETAAAVDESYSYDDAVVFPFGYGLSYTTFSQTLDSVEEKDGQVVVTATVTNTGERAGKDVAQAYFSAPYTQLDQQAQIEKPVCVLAAFTKTKLLEPGESQVVTMTFSKQDMASYCYTHDNPDGTTGCYVLEAGDYVVSLRNNSHDVLAEKAVVQNQTIWFDGSDAEHVRDAEKAAQSDLDPATGEALVDETATYTAATNRFQQSSDYMNSDSTLLSRTDWGSTQPAYQASKEISEQYKEGSDLFITFDPATDETYGNVEGSKVYAAEEPTSGADNGLTLADLRGADYDDSRWSDLLDQINWDSDKDGLIRNFAGSAYTTGAIESIGLPQTTDEDGANGLKVQGNDHFYGMEKSSSFGFAPLMASTWNVELLYEVGSALGQESLANGISGWYAPAINLHRSMFSGRVFEYFSEDPLLSGKLAAAAISGAGDQGMYCYVKHFALNETETGRSSLVATWADEQTMRELYLRPFEIALEEARMTLKYSDSQTGEVKEKVMRAGTAVMSTQTCIGMRIGHNCDATLKDVLRGEWGFEGMVISDYWVWQGDNMRDLCLRTGCDTYLCMAMPFMWNVSDYDSATAHSVMREAVHNIAYTIVNSNAMQGAVPGSTFSISTPSWRVAITVTQVVITLLLVGGVVLIVRRTKAERCHPEAYRRSKRKQAKLDAKLAVQGK